jgi:hypothetical protein
MLIVLLIGAFVRIGPLVNVPPWWDEVWSMWQTQSSLAQTIGLTPYDWPPLYYVVLRVWTFLVGPNDVTGRYMSLLFGLLAIAFVYRAGCALNGQWTGLYAGLHFQPVQRQEHSGQRGFFEITNEPVHDIARRINCRFTGQILKQAPYEILNIRIVVEAPDKYATRNG